MTLLPLLLALFCFDLFLPLLLEVPLLAELREVLELLGGALLPFLFSLISIPNAAVAVVVDLV
jgi:hypothetical protein